MSKELGSTFSVELYNAGLSGLPIKWGDDSDSVWCDVEVLTNEQQATLQGVIDAHDPDASELFAAVSDAKNSISLAMYARINQGIRWAWSAQEPENIIKLASGMREILSSWHQLITQPTPAVQPHGGFIKSGGMIFKGPGDIDIPDAAIVEIAEFAGLWVSEISRIAIAQETLVEAMDLAQLQSYDASAIDWTVTWSGHADWSNDLVLYNP